MPSAMLSAFALAAALISPVLAQTHTLCNPLNTTGCPNMPALGGNATFNFTDTWNVHLWEKKNQGDVKWTGRGNSFTIARRGDAPYIQSSWYMLFGTLTVVMKAAPGTGIVSSAILQSECLDEIDWEFLGGNTTHVLTNYFGKGNTTDYTRGKEYRMKSAPQDDYHNYTIDWTKDRTQWWIDGEMLRELKFGDALGGKNYPQTPMNVRLGAWSGGDVLNNDKYTVEWAGGETNFDQGPFTMMVQSVYVKDYTTAKEYSWEDMDASGSWEKVKIISPETKSEALKEIESPHGVKDRWKALSQTAKIGIAAGIAGGVLLLVAIITFCCIKQRRAGRREHAAYEAEVNKEAADMLQHKQEWVLSHSRNSRYTRI